MRFLADESCDFRVVAALRSAEHEVRAVAEVARGAPDETVVELALTEQRILLTED
jgi:predicted nuclease of predicted toxin-antitoxin system